MMTNQTSVSVGNKAFMTRWSVVVGIAAAVCCFFLSAGFAHALITYDNAVGGPSGNTVNTTTNSTTDWFVAADAADNLWDDRTDPPAASSGLGGDVFESFTPYPENSPELTTTITGLVPIAFYDVYVIYWTNNGNWRLQAGLASNSLTTWTTADATATIGSSSGLIQLQGLLGTARTGVGGTIPVFVDDVTHNPALGDDRAWYDGVAYEFEGLAPEPASLGLLLLGVPLLARRRR